MLVWAVFLKNFSTITVPVQLFLKAVENKLELKPEFCLVPAYMSFWTEKLVGFTANVWFFWPLKLRENPTS